MRQSMENTKMMSRLLERINVDSLLYAVENQLIFGTADRGAVHPPPADADARIQLDEHGTHRTCHGAGYYSPSESRGTKVGPILT